MVKKTFVIDDRTVAFYAELNFSGDAPLITGGSNIITLKARESTNVHPDDMAQAVLGYLKEKINPELKYARTMFIKDGGVPLSAEGVFYISDKPTLDAILFRATATMKHFLRIEGKSTMCNSVNVIPLNEDHLRILLDYARQN